jgi:DNA gyrase/topoisomerase IV subunit A
VTAIPDVKPSQRGSTPGGLLAGLESGENIVSILELPGQKLKGQLMLATKQGMVKLTEYAQFVVRGTKFAAIKLREGDALIAVRELKGEANVLMITAGGLSKAFAISEVSVTGRVGMGVRGINVADDDECIAAMPFEPEGELLLVSDRGYMKRCLLVDFEIQARGGKGVKCFGLLKNGANGTRIAGALNVRLPYDFVVEQQRSGAVRLNTEEIKIESRAARGTPYVPATAMDPVVALWQVIG